MNERIYRLQFFNFRDMKNHERRTQKRIVINIRKLNKIFEFNVYSIFFQSNIIIAVINALYIFVINCARYLY